MEEIYALLDYIETEMRAKSGILGKSIDKNAILGYTARIRELLSDALGEKRIKEELLKAKQIVEMAEAKQKELIEETAIVEAAKKRAAEIQQTAIRKAQEFSAATKKTLQGILSDSAKQLDDAFRSVNKAAENLKNNL